MLKFSMLVSITATLKDLSGSEARFGTVFSTNYIRCYAGSCLFSLFSMLAATERAKTWYRFYSKEQYVPMQSMPMHPGHIQKMILSIYLPARILGFNV